MVKDKDMEIFYKKVLKKILNFKASELSTVEFEQVKRSSEKLEVYRFWGGSNEFTKRNIRNTRKEQ